MRTLLLAMVFYLTTFHLVHADADPFMWLEQVDSPRSLAWVHAENAKTLKALQANTHYAGFYTEALKLAEATDRIPVPDFLAQSIANFWQDSAHAQGIWRVTTAADYQLAAPAWHTLLDLDQLSKVEGRHWVWKGANCFHPADQRCLVSLSEGGEDAVTTREFDVSKARFAPDGFTIPHAKQVVDWQDANTLILGTDWGAGSLTTSGYPYIIKRLSRGEKLSQAHEIFRGTAQDVGVQTESFTDGSGHHAIVLVRDLDFFRNELWLVLPDGVRKLALPEKAEPEGLLKNQLIVKLNQDFTAPGGHLFTAGMLVTLDLADKAAVPHALFTPSPSQSVVEVAATAHHIIVTILDNVRGRALSFTPAGAGFTQRTLPLPDNASVAIEASSANSDNVYLLVNSFLSPTTLFLADTNTNKAPVVIKTLPAKFDASGDVAEQRQATSRDGTKIPYFIVHPRNMKLDGSNPTLLYAYGGFQVSETPTYSASLGKLWLERGGVYVLANIRGGGEFGPAWHDAGLKTHRQRIYDDFAAVAEDLIARHVTSPAHLGIRGGSNGGLLMGVEFEQHPDLWHAVIIDVPLLDMLRFENIAAGASWVGEYGSVSVPAERAFLAGISPYNNLKPNVSYPVPFIFTTTKDDRVGPVHARKFAALMASMHHPFYYYESTEGGHAAGANLKEVAQEQALEMTYLTSKIMDTK